MSKSKLLSYAVIVCLTVSSIALAIGVPEPNKPNLNNDNRVDFADYAIMGQNWQKTGTKLAGDLDGSNTVDINDLVMFCWYWLEEYSQYQQCEKVDLNGDGIIDFEDLSKFAQNWLSAGTGLTGDFDDSNLVDCKDFSIFANCWRKGNNPIDIWEQFKTALRNDDLNTALSFIADAEKEKYTIALTQLRPQFQSMVNGMGELILISMDSNRAKYEMLHDEGGGVIASFPVYFTKDEHDNWKIYCF
jgi:hypothetical protein